MSFFAHDPDAGSLDYSIDFTDWLAAGDTVSTVDWTVWPAGPVLSSPTINGAVATVLVSGGVRGNQYRLTANVTSGAGRVDQRSIVLQMGQL
ncbi:MAG: hypothetical protein CMF31_05075 [Kordiimonas sp.]|nr:hypothetical protein [Kordiimonas sp.]